MVFSGVGNTAIVHSRMNMIATVGVPTERVSFLTSDGITVVGTFVPAKKLRAPALLLLHMLGRDKNTYAPVIPALREAGYGLLALDFRGHGDSTEKNRQKFSWEDFEEADWKGTLIDAQEALAVLRKERGVDPERIGIIGASIGANIALTAAGNDPGVRSLVLLSPGADYRGIPAEPGAIKSKDRPALIAVAQDDSYSHDSSQALSKIMPQATVHVIKGDVHGTNMFAADPSLIEKIVQHLQNTLPSAQ
jgi:pimeloyl-ACP methyl ester carboxylesterase